MFLEVIKAQYVNEYRIKLWFNNGEMRMVDLKDSLNGPVFQPLKDLDFFKKLNNPIFVTSHKIFPIRF